MRGHLRSVIHAARQTAHGCALRLVLWEKLKGRRVDGRQGAGDNPIERTPSIHSILHLFPFTLRLDSPISLCFIFQIISRSCCSRAVNARRRSRAASTSRGQQQTRKGITFNRLLRRPSELLFDLDVNCAARRHRAPNMTTPSPSHLFPAALIAAQHVRYEKERSQCY